MLEAQKITPVPLIDPDPQVLRHQWFWHVASPQQQAEVLRHATAERRRTVLRAMPSGRRVIVSGLLDDLLDDR